MPDAKVKIALELNGDAVEVAFAPHKTLLEVLRQDLGLTGTKHGCELGECGTCTVLLDATPVLSCLVLGLACAGRRVKTVEGMAAGGTLHPLQEAFAELGAAQLLHTSVPSRRRSASRDKPASDARRDQAGALGQPLPLHRLHQDLRSRRAGGGSDARRGREAGAGDPVWRPVRNPRGSEW